MEGTEESTEPGPSTSAGSYPLEFSEEGDDTPRKKKLRRKLFQEVIRSQKKTKKIRVLTQSLKRQKKKVFSLKHLLLTLKNNNLIDTEKSQLLENMSSLNKQMLQRKLTKNKKFSPELRKFVITLNFFSPKAYDFVRNVFDTCLPHRRTIGKWLQTINAAPGFTSEAFETLRKHVIENQNKPIICALVIDEMSIRQQLEWDGKVFHGYVNFGVDIDDDSNELAKEAFVVMIVAINGTWKLPVGYFLANGLNGQQKCNIIKQCIALTENTGARVVSLTCDGAASNISMANLLGCSFQFPNVQTKLTINKTNNMYFFLDPCHMVKLVRNAFGEKNL